MRDLIEALQILAKYQKETRCPTHCEHDVLMVMDVKENEPSEQDRARLNELGFIWLSHEECWGSYRFGSA